MMKAIPHRKLKALGLNRGATRMFARYVDGKPGKFAEFWLGGVDSRDEYAIIDGRLTQEWERFISHASFQRDHLLQFGLLLPRGERFMCTGYILSLFPTTPECVRFTIDFVSPWAEV